MRKRGKKKREGKDGEREGRMRERGKGREGEEEREGWVKKD